MILLDDYYTDDHTKYLLLTRFIHEERIIEPPTRSKVLIGTQAQWFFRDT